MVSIWKQNIHLALMLIFPELDKDEAVQRAERILGQFPMTLIINLETIKPPEAFFVFSNGLWLMARPGSGQVSPGEQKRTIKFWRLLHHICQPRYLPQEYFAALSGEFLIAYCDELAEQTILLINFILFFTDNRQNPEVSGYLVKQRGRLQRFRDDTKQYHVYEVSLPKLISMVENVLVYVSQLQPTNNYEEFLAAIRSRLERANDLSVPLEYDDWRVYVREQVRLSGLSPSSES